MIDRNRIEQPFMTVLVQRIVVIIDYQEHHAADDNASDQI